METGLVALEDTDRHRRLLGEAAACADSADADLVLLWILDPAEHDRKLDTLETVGRVEHADYDTNVIFEGAAEDARRLARDVLGETGTDLHVVVAVADEDERADAILDSADDNGCDHVFLVGEGRSPAGKVLFGNVAQRVVLDFDGYVTLRTY